MPLLFFSFYKLSAVIIYYWSRSLINVRGSGTAPENSAPEKSNPGCSRWNRSSISRFWSACCSALLTSWPAIAEAHVNASSAFVSCTCKTPSSVIDEIKRSKLCIIRQNLYRMKNKEVGERWEHQSAGAKDECLPIVQSDSETFTAPPKSFCWYEKQFSVSGSFCRILF